MATDKIIIGHFGSPFGVCGWLHIHSHSGRRDTFLQNSVWWCARPDGPWQKINIAQIRPQGARLTAKIAGVDDREQASFWRHANIAVQRADLPPLTAEDEYYWCDLVGLQAQNTGGEILGVVKKLLSSGQQDTLCIAAADGKKDILVPFAEPIVSRVDLDGGIIVLAWERDW